MNPSAGRTEEGNPLRCQPVRQAVISTQQGRLKYGEAQAGNGGRAKEHGRRPWTELRGAAEVKAEWSKSYP